FLCLGYALSRAAASNGLIVSIALSTSTSSRVPVTQRAVVGILCLLLLVATSVQVAHFCNLNLSAGSSSPILVDAAQTGAPCAICLASHSAASVVSKLALSPALVEEPPRAVQPLEIQISGTTLPYFVRPPPQPISA